MLTNEQQNALRILLSGRNAFITGKAGTGKSYLVNQFISISLDRGKKVIVTAPTGIAALNVDGSTLHRAFKVHPGVLVEAPKLSKIPQEIINADIIVIDEISMCRIDLFEYVSKIIFGANKYRYNTDGLGPIQLVVVGDFLQLPPVVTQNDKTVLNDYYGHNIGYGFAFQSELWNEHNFDFINLKEVTRQSDAEFAKCLSYVRAGYSNALNYISKMSSPTPIPGAIYLCGTNNKAKEKNDWEFNRLGTKIHTFKANITGDVNESDKATDTILQLRIGTRVMTLVNDPSGEYSNGSFGMIESIDEKTESVVVKMDSGAKVDILPYTWEIKKYSYDSKLKKLNKEVAGTFEQLPLKLAWAITIHKSQGQTYDAVNLNPYCWDCGQLYVALSRVKELRKMCIVQPLYSKYLVTSKEVIDFYTRMSRN